MFTGIIEEVGEIVKIEESGDFRTITVRGHQIFDDLRTGSSIAVNGVCLTARTVADDTFSAEMSRETLERTSLGDLRRATIVNLERPMRADARFGGHIVQGHVDGVGRIAGHQRPAFAELFELDCPDGAWAGGVGAGLGVQRAVVD